MFNTFLIKRENKFIIDWQTSLCWVSDESGHNS